MQTTQPTPTSGTETGLQALDTQFSAGAPELRCPHEGCEFQVFTEPSFFGVRSLVTQSRYSTFDTPCQHFIDRYQPARESLSAFLSRFEGNPNVIITGSLESDESPSASPLAAYRSPTAATGGEGQ